MFQTAVLTLTLVLDVDEPVTAQAIRDELVTALEARGLPEGVIDAIDVQDVRFR